MKLEIDQNLWDLLVKVHIWICYEYLDKISHAASVTEDCNPHPGRLTKFPAGFKQNIPE